MKRLALSLAFAFASTALLAAPASAQPVGPTGLTPWDAPTLRADSLSTRSNPATLTFLNGVHSATVISGVPESDDRASVGWNIAGGFGRIAGFGLAVEGDGDTTTSTFGLGLGTDRMAVGFSSTRWFSDVDRPTDGFSTTRLAFAARPSNNVGAGFTIHELTTPRFAGTPLPRRYVPSLGLRTSNGSFELDLRYEFVRDDSDLNTFGATALARPTRGLRLFAGTTFRPADIDTGLGIVGGLEISGGHMTATGATHVSITDGDATFGIVGAVEFSSRPAPGFVRRDRFLRVDLAGEFRETPGARLIGNGAPVFTDTIAELHAAADDPTIGGLYLNLGGITAGTAQLYELRQAIREVQARGKTVVAYFDRATVRDLYVAGSADVRIASPTLSVLTTGIGMTRTYFGDMLNRLGMDAYFVRIGDYKSGPERFTNGGPSDEAEAQTQAYLDTVWDILVDGIAENFAMSPDEAAEWLADAPISAEDLEEAGLVADILYRDELSGEIDALVGRPVHVVGERRPDTRSEYWVDPNVIAVLHIDGPIVMGRSGDSLFGTQAGAETIEEVARELAESHEVRGVIVRINSPGGSALASDRMHRALSRLAESKPVVVSMGGVAASGGIYAAVFGERIFATPSTLTGSIGIYAGTVALDGLLERWGINRVHDDRGSSASRFDGRAWDDEDIRAVTEHITDAYDRFVDRVAEGRDMTPEEVDAIGQGHIWSGREAAENGLVDSLGGFAGALAEIRSEAEIRDGAPITLAHYPRPRPNVFSVLPSAPSASAGLGWAEIAEELGLTPVLSLLNALSSEPAGSAMAQLEWVIEGI